MKEGKTPAKADMKSFLEALHESRHIPNDEDAELITRFEMQQFCPDILITNYSMLEYMLLRPREAKMWNDTKDWLESDPKTSCCLLLMKLICIGDRQVEKLRCLFVDYSIN